MKRFLIVSGIVLAAVAALIITRVKFCVVCNRDLDNSY